MAENIVAGLFGLDPYQIQQQRQAQIDAQARNYAEMSPIQKIESGWYKTGAELGKIGAGMLGMVDPLEEQARRTQAIMAQGGADLSTPEGVFAKAKVFADAGDQKTALQLTLLGRQMQAEASKQALEAAKAQHEIVSATELPKMRHEEQLLRLQNAAEQAKQRSIDMNLSIQQRADAAREANATRLQIAQLMASMKDQQKKTLSATAQKEIFEADEAAMGSKAGAKALQEALDINDKAMGYVGAGTVATVGSLLPDIIRPKKFDVTLELDNIVQQSVLPQLKSIFGANPTEGERKILLDVAGSSSKPANVRKGIFERAKLAAENRARFNEQKASSLRQGTYFTENPNQSEPNIPIQNNIDLADAARKELARRKGNK